MLGGSSVKPREMLSEADVDPDEIGTARALQW